MGQKPAPRHLALRVVVAERFQYDASHNHHHVIPWPGDPQPLWPAHTGTTAQRRPGRVASLPGRRRWLRLVFSVVTVGSELHFPVGSVALPRTGFQGLKANAHLAAATAAALPSTSWGPAELLRGGQRRKTRCTLWSEYRPGGVGGQVTPCRCAAIEKLTVKRRRLEEGTEWGRL